MNTHEELRKAIEWIARKNGGTVTADDVIAHARDKRKYPGTVLHGLIEWDKERNAAAYLLVQARMLIRSVHVVIKTETTVIRAPAYIRDPTKSEREQGYRAVASLRTETDLAREAVVAEFSRAAGALSRARSVAAVLALEDEIDELLQSVDVLRMSVEHADERAAQ